MTILPGVTISGLNSTATHRDVSFGNGEALVAVPGPDINGRSTTLSLYSPAQLRESLFLPSMVNVANEAFKAGHVEYKLIPDDIPRIPAEKNLLEELDKGPGSFTYIIHSNDTDVIATCSMWHFTYTPVLEAIGATPEQLDKIRRSQAFNRQGAMPDGVMGWEMKLLVVDRAAQGMGLASHLMQLCEKEATRRYRLQRDSSIYEMRIILTCIAEINARFYKKRGFKEDYSTWQPVGTLGSPNGFGVMHMSKTIDVEH